MHHSSIVEKLNNLIRMEKAMSSMDTLRSEFKQFLLSWLELHIPGFSEILFNGIVVLWIALFALTLHLFLQIFLRRLLVRLSNKHGQLWHRALLENNLFRRLSYILQGAVVHIQAGLWLDESSTTLRLTESVSEQWMLLFGLLSLFSLLNILQSLMYLKAGHLHFPLRGLIQTVKLVASLLIGLLAISMLMGKSPLILFSSLGALSAVLLLVFKDAILSAGDLLLAPYRLTDRFLSFVTANEEFRPFIESGLAQAIGQAGHKMRDQLYETPQTVSWDRVSMRLPGIMYELVDVIEQEKQRYQ